MEVRWSKNEVWLEGGRGEVGGGRGGKGLFWLPKLFYKSNIYELIYKLYIKTTRNYILSLHGTKNMAQNIILWGEAGFCAHFLARVECKTFSLIARLASIPNTLKPSVVRNTPLNASM